MKRKFTFLLMALLALAGFKSWANPVVSSTANVPQVITHTITVVQPAVGGTISVSANEAAAGTPIYIYTNPAQGYKLNKWYVKKESGEVVMEDVAIGFYMLNFNITVTADFVLAPQDLTVNDGTDVIKDNNSSQIPFNGYNADNYNNKSQFIIPASALGSMANASVTDITFYLNSESSNKEYTYDFFDIYVKEVKG